MKITEESIKGLDLEELINYLVDYRYNGKVADFFESQNFGVLPEFLKHFFYILEFETEYEMSGLLTFLVNSIRQYINEITNSFKITGNTEIASMLASIQEVLFIYQLSTKDLNNSLSKSKLYEISTSGKPYSNDDIFGDLKAIDEKLNLLISQKTFWTNVKSYLQHEIKK